MTSLSWSESWSFRVMIRRDSSDSKGRRGSKTENWSKTLIFSLESCDLKRRSSFILRTEWTFKILGCLIKTFLISFSMGIKPGERRFSLFLRRRTSRVPENPTFSLKKRASLEKGWFFLNCSKKFSLNLMSFTWIEKKVVRTAKVKRMAFFFLEQKL